MTELHRHLMHFQQQVNACASLRRLLKGWDREIAVVAHSETQTAQSATEGFRLSFKDALLTDVVPGAPDDAEIHLSGSQGVLERMFSGVENPATLVLDGRLQVIASDKDQVKLDAVALVLWD